MPPRRKANNDGENPEWTETDFATAKPAHDGLPSRVLSAFKRTRGPQRTPKKVPVSIRLSPEVVEHFKETGSGWQSRIDDVLRKAMGRRG